MHLECNHTYDRLSKSRTDKMPLLSRIYVWSIILEPLLFFVLFERTVSGVAGNLSRILQMTVVSSLILKLLASFLNLRLADVRVVSFASPLYINYVIYFYLVIFAGFIGFLSGAYYLPGIYSYNVG